MIAVLDASAALKLVVDEPDSDRMRQLWDQSLTLVAPVLVLPEVAAGITGCLRAGRLSHPGALHAHQVWTALAEEIDLVSMDTAVAAAARDIAATRVVRGMDAVYLAVATRLAVHSAVGLVSFDARQRSALRPGDGVHLLPAEVG